MTLILPTQGYGIGPIITSVSWFSIGPTLSHAISAPASLTWGTGMKCIYVPFQLMRPFQVLKLLAYNGGVANGNTDISVYDADFNEIVSIAAAAQAGTNAWQQFDVTDQWLQSERYYWGLQNSGTTGAYYQWSSLQYAAIAGVLEELKGSANLPTVATPAKLTAAAAPIVGMSSRTLI